MRHPTVSRSPCFDELSLICENDRPFIRAESVARVPSPRPRGTLEKYSASASPLNAPRALVPAFRGDGSPSP